MAEGELRPSSRDSVQIAVERQDVPDVELGRYLYGAVGRDYHWTDRSQWTDAQWLKRLALPNVEMWVAHEGQAMAGYFELDMDEGGNVEIAYFGLLSGYIGRGVGGRLLTIAARRAWQMGACRVWLLIGKLPGPGLPRVQEGGVGSVLRTVSPRCQSEGLNPAAEVAGTSRGCNSSESVLDCQLPKRISALGAG